MQSRKSRSKRQSAGISPDLWGEEEQVERVAFLEEYGPEARAGTGQEDLRRQKHTRTIAVAAAEASSPE